MSANPKRPVIKFQFAITQPANESYAQATQVMGINFSDDVVPAGRDPVEYLRERVLAELDRVTLVPAGPGSSRPTVRLPGYEVAKPAEGEVPF